MTCSQTLAQQNAAMRAALVTVQKKLQCFDAQVGDLQLQNEGLLNKVGYQHASLHTLHTLRLTQHCSHL